jgi:tetratricopeptide (TPR) repeat protein
VGDFVFPKRTPAELRVGYQVTAEVAVDDYLIVLERQGDWLWVECRDLQATDVSGPRGWVPVSEVDDLDEQIRYWKEDAREEASTDPLDYYFLGLICRLSDEPYYLKEAISYFTRAIQLAPADELYYQMRSYCWGQLEQYELAIEDLEMALALDPGNEDYQRALDVFRQYVEGGERAPAPPAPGATL